MRDLAQAQNNAGPYTTQQINNALLSASTRVGCRFEILDQYGSPAAGIILETLTGPPSAAVAGGILNAVCDWDATRAVRKTLSLKLFPVAGLLGVPFQYWVRPWFQVGMPDGGLCELNMGTYLWVEPQRSVQQIGALNNVEVWDVTMGDHQHLLDAQGPASGGLTLSGSVAQTIASLLAQYAGATDTSRISDPGKTLASSLFYSTSPTPFGAISVQVDPVAALRQHLVALYDLFRNLAPNTPVPPNPPAASAVFAAAGSASPTTINKMLDDLMYEYGFDVGYFDFNDVYVARLVDDLTTVSPSIVYTAETLTHPSGWAPGSRLDVITGHADIQVDSGQVANIVYVRANYVTPGSTQISMQSVTHPAGIQANFVGLTPSTDTFPTNAIGQLIAADDNSIPAGTYIVGYGGNPPCATTPCFQVQISQSSTHATLAAVNITYNVPQVSETPSSQYTAIGYTAVLDNAMPNHPLAGARIKVNIPATIDVTSTTDPAVLRAAGDAELLRRALSYKTVTLDTLAYPAHEGHEIVGLIIPGDAEYSTVQLHKEVAWSIDLLAGTAKHTMKRIYV